jgi:serine/threonine-protein kinase
VPNPTRREGAGAQARQQPFEPKPGLVVAGKYRVDRIIGEGGMGIVAAATHVELDQHVAIKFLLPEAMRHEEAVERFLREAKVAARVKSEHVARVSDVGRTEPDDVPFIVMEYLEGSDLGALIAERGKLPVEEVCEIALQACEALAEVHAAGIVHRDLKPSNLFVTRRADESPCLKLLDFGISKFSVHPGDVSVDPALTATATIMGSPSYMSPEQLRSTKEVDARTDVWALGAVLYEALTGKPAFRGETVPQVCFMIGSEEPTAPSSLRADLPPELERILLACLDKKAETRASVVELARVLVVYAPPRAQATLERIEALGGQAGSPAPRRTAPSAPLVKLAAPPLPPPETARTQASWHDDERRSSKRGGGIPIAFVGLVVLGLVGVALYTGTVDVSGLRGKITHATNAVGSAVTSATAAAESAVPSVPTLPSSLTPSLPSSFAPSFPSALPSSIPIPGLGASLDLGGDPESNEADDEEDTEDAAAPAAPSATTSHGAPQRALVPLPGPHPVPAKHTPHPRHFVHKAVHKRR